MSYNPLIDWQLYKTALIRAIYSLEELHYRRVTGDKIAKVREIIESKFPTLDRTGTDEIIKIVERVGIKNGWAKN